MMHPWLTVIIPTYNGESYLPAVFSSIAEQKDNDLECIVIDDGSTDATFSIIDAYRDRLPIKLLQRERQGNWVANTNYALTLAKSEYVCFLHQDDIWLKNRLATMKRVIKQYPAINLFLHSSYFIDTNGNYLGIWQCPLTAFPKIVRSELMIERLLVQNFVAIPATIFRRDTALKVGGLDETAWYTADWDFWLKIAASSDSLYYPKPLSGFRIHPSSQTVVRSFYVQDFREQLEHVAAKHLALYEGPEHKKRKIRKIANFSILVNSSLAGAFHGTRPSLGKLLAAFLLLGPSGWHRYFRDSRIWERVSARLKAKLAHLSKPQSNA